MVRTHSAMAKILLEICCASLEDAVEAERGGANRIELCSALELGGLTPSAGTIAEVKSRLKIPVMIMLRPRAGGFCYSDAEMKVMEADAQLAMEAGGDGLVMGILHPDGAVDVERCARFTKITEGREMVFHRAFDLTPDAFSTLDQIAAIGFRRILTSGQRPSVDDDSATKKVAELIRHSGGRIEIMPGGGIREQNVTEIVERTGCRQVHLTAFQTAYDRSTRQRPEVTFSVAPGPEDEYRVTDWKQVRRIAELLQNHPS